MRVVRFMCPPNVGARPLMGGSGQVECCLFSPGGLSDRAASASALGHEPQQCFQGLMQRAAFAAVPSQLPLEVKQQAPESRDPPKLEAKAAAV